jgi:DNA-binding IclR family transcriptional regulator
MTARRTQDGTINAVDRCLQVIELLKEQDGAGITEIATELDWAKSTVHSHLKTLEVNEYVTRQGNQYVLGFPFLELGEYVNTREPAFAAVEPKVEELAEQTGKRVQFIKNEHGYAVYVRIAKGQHAVSTGSRHGRRRPMLHASAAGKAILAFLPQCEVEAIIDRRGLREFTPNTVTDPEKLFDELSTVRDRGFAFNREEHISGLRAVAAPVRNGGRVVGSLSVAGAARRMQGDYFEEELPELLLGVVNEVELDLEYS